MPPSYTDDQIVYAARDGRIQPAQLDRMAQGMIDLVNKTRAAMSIEGYRFDIEAHDEVAHRAAIESMVLLKNDDAILPVANDAKVTVIGEFARTPRYQGGGSSHITPTKMTSFLDTLTERGVDAKFAPGFTLDLEPADPALEAEAVDAAKGADVVLMFLGLPEAAESEGFDRETLDMPAKQIALLEAVAAENKNVVVVLSNGSVVTVAPWAKNAKGILESWLLGQSGGPALADAVRQGEPVRQARADHSVRHQRRSEHHQLAGRRGACRLRRRRVRGLPLLRHLQQGRRLPVRIRPELRHVRSERREGCQDRCLYRIRQRSGQEHLER